MDSNKINPKSALNQGTNSTLAPKEDCSIGKRHQTWWTVPCAMVLSVLMVTALLGMLFFEDEGSSRVAYARGGQTPTPTPRPCYRRDLLIEEGDINPIHAHLEVCNGDNDPDSNSSTTWCNMECWYVPNGSDECDLQCTKRMYQVITWLDNEWYLSRSYAAKIWGYSAKIAYAARAKLGANPPFVEIKDGHSLEAAGSLSVDVGANLGGWITVGISVTGGGGSLFESGNEAVEEVAGENDYSGIIHYANTTLKYGQQGYVGVGSRGWSPAGYTTQASTFPVGEMETTCSQCEFEWNFSNPL